MTPVVFAIPMIVTWLSALMASADHIFGNALSHPLVEHKIFPNEVVFKAQVANLPDILDNASVKLEHVLESLVLYPGACLLAPDTSGAIHQNIFCLLASQQVDDQL